MKIKKLFVYVVMAVLFLTLVGTQPVTAQAVKTDFTGVETLIGELDPGVTTVLPNGGAHVRGRLVTYSESATDPRITGTSTVVMNGNLNASLTGPIWGTFVLEVTPSEACPGGGSWEGTWAGAVSYTKGYCYLHLVSHGVSGCVEGLQATYNGECIYGTYGGTIVDPHGE